MVSWKREKMLTDKYGNDLRAGYHVADLRKDNKQRGKVVVVGYPPTGPYIESGLVTVEWENGEEESLSAKDVVITDTIHIRRRRR
jgi:hypothetical protein